MSFARQISKLASMLTSGGLITPEAMSGGGPGFRNRIINGSAIIGQRGPINVTTTTPAYGTDRMLMGVVSGTGINVALTKGGFGGNSSGYGHYMYGSMTGGTPYWCQRIEGQNTFDLNGKNITVSGVVYQDSGSSQQFVVRIAKANAFDNFSGGITTLGQSTAFTVPSGGTVPFSAIFSLGATDASNGLMVEVFTIAPVTCTNKYFILTDLQLEKGAIISPSFEFRHAGFELALCQRYCYAQVSGGAAYYSFGISSSNGTTPIANIKFPVTMRISPSISSISSGTTFIFASGSPSTISVDQVSPDNAWVYGSGGSSGTGGYSGRFLANNTSSAYIIWSSEL